MDAPICKVCGHRHWMRDPHNFKKAKPEPKRAKRKPLRARRK